MARARQAIGAAIAAAAIAVAASACEGTPPPPASSPTAGARPGVDPLKSLTSYQIIRRAFANTEAAASVSISGKVEQAGQIIRLSSLSLVNGGSGCVADIYEYGHGSVSGSTFQLIDDGSTAWVLPSMDFWQGTGTRFTAVLPRVEGKYLQVKPGPTGLDALPNLCSLDTLVGTGPSPKRKTGIGAPIPTVVAGVPALKIPDQADGGYLTVSDAAKPVLLSFYVGGANGGDFSLTYFTTPVTMAAPPSDEVVLGSQYGL